VINLWALGYSTVAILKIKRLTIILNHHAMLALAIAYHSLCRYHANCESNALYGAGDHKEYLEYRGLLTAKY
jgi:hypothetical protein